MIYDVLGGYIISHIALHVFAEMWNTQEKVWKNKLFNSAKQGQDQHK